MACGGQRLRCTDPRRPGTLAYAVSGTDIGVWCDQCGRPFQGQGRGVLHYLPTCLLHGARFCHSVACYAISLHACYTMPGINVAFVATRARAVASRGTGQELLEARVQRAVLRYQPTRSYAVPGIDLAYQPARCLCDARY
eukprot:413778-Rhodomonas_salina.5